MNDVYNVGMFALSAQNHLDSSPNSEALLLIKNDISVFLEGYGDIGFNDSVLWVTPSDIKLDLTDTAVSTSLQIT